MKTCSSCNISLDLSEFYRDKSSGKLSSQCKPCCRRATAAWKKKNRDKVRYYHNIYMKTWRLSAEQIAKYKSRKYLISVEEYSALAKAACNICGKKFKHESAANVDHDHKSGKVRGVLCRSCNTGIGLFKDDVFRLYNAAKYLVKERD